jgi:glycosyltransferase involved in cell wall biosynthesis
MSAAHRLTVLHYTGADDDRSGIISAIRSVATADLFECVLGVNGGFKQQRTPPLESLALPRTQGEKINVRACLRARAVARAVQWWLADDERRIFHGHSRAGLLVGLWLHWFGERRVVVSVHCYGKQRWFYRWAERRLQDRVYWLTPAMKRYYGVGSADWDRCIPNSMPVTMVAPRRRRLRPGYLALGGAGMLVPWKQWDLVLAALAKLPADMRARVSFSHIGATNSDEASAKYAQSLQEKTKRLGLESQVQWLGWQPSSAELLANVDCMLITSRLEPFSMAALESLFAGVPVIAPNEGGLTDFVGEKRGGWFFRSSDANDLGAVIRTLLRSDDIAHVQIEPNQLARFEAGRVAEQWRAVYEAAMQP